MKGEGTMPAEVDIEAVGRGLTKAQRVVICGGVTWSGAQRNRLIAKGVAPETCRGASALPRQSPYHAFQYALPLTTLGLAVREWLIAQEEKR